MDNITIDSEFQSLIPPLTDDEFQRLEKSILSEGVREPIITWNGVIIDGHNRYRICEKHGLDFKTTEREFDSRDAAKIWIYENQLGRRNLEPGQRAALVIERSEAEAREQARLRQVQHANTAPGRPKNTVGPRAKSDENLEQEKMHTHEILAKQAGVSPTTVKRVLGIKRKDPELFEQVRNGEIGAHEAYRRVTNEKRPEPKNTKRNYHDAERSLRENVPVYSVDSLIMELTYSAETLRESWQSSIETNESMGVKLTKANKARLEKAVSNLFAVLEKLGRKPNDA